jgi:Na+/melibiose symporter-like transporter
MNCCGHDNEKHKKHKSGHLWMMVLCCGIPILILLMLPLINGILPGASNILGAAVPFLCPVMMFVMMFFMFRNGKKENSGNDCHTETKL